MFKSRALSWIFKIGLAASATFFIAGSLLGINSASADSDKIGREYREVSRTEYKVEFQTSRGDFCVGFVSTYSKEAVALACDFNGGKK